MSLKSLLGLDTKSHKLASGERITIQPLTVRQAFVVEQVFTPIADDIITHGVDDLVTYAQHADALVKLVAVAVGREVEWVDSLPRADFNALLAKLLDVEKDFFNALVMARAAQQQKANPAAGPRSSKR